MRKAEKWIASPQKLMGSFESARIVRVIWKRVPIFRSAKPFWYWLSEQAVSFVIPSLNRASLISLFWNSVPWSVRRIFASGLSRFKSGIKANSAVCLILLSSFTNTQRVASSTVTLRYCLLPLVRIICLLDVSLQRVCPNFVARLLFVLFLFIRLILPLWHAAHGSNSSRSFSLRLVKLFLRSTRLILPLLACPRVLCKWVTRSLRSCDCIDRLMFAVFGKILSKSCFVMHGMVV